MPCPLFFLSHIFSLPCFLFDKSCILHIPRDYRMFLSEVFFTVFLKSHAYPLSELRYFSEKVLACLHSDLQQGISVMVREKVIMCKYLGASKYCKSNQCLKMEGFIRLASHSCLRPKYQLAPVNREVLSPHLPMHFLHWNKHSCCLKLCSKSLLMWAADLKKQT